MEATLANLSKLKVTNIPPRDLRGSDGIVSFWMSKSEY